MRGGKTEFLTQFLCNLLHFCAFLCLGGLISAFSRVSVPSKCQEPRVLCLMTLSMPTDIISIVGGLHPQGPPPATDENKSTKTRSAWGGKVADLSKEKGQETVPQ